MVPVSALEATSNTFAGHRFGIFQVDRWENSGNSVSWKQVMGECKDSGYLTSAKNMFCSKSLPSENANVLTNSPIPGIVKPALISTGLALISELLLLLRMSLGGSKSFGKYLSGSEEISELVEKMWRTIDWVSTSLPQN